MGKILSSVICKMCKVLRVYGLWFMVYPPYTLHHSPYTLHLTPSRNSGQLLHTVGMSRTFAGVIRTGIHQSPR